MRSILLVILALVLCVGGFLAYQFNQGPIASNVNTSDSLTPLHLDPNVQTLHSSGPGDRPWMKSFDNDGRLASQFRAREYQPRGDGIVHCQGVQVDFYQYLHDAKNPAGRVQRVRIEGREGDIEVPGDQSGKSADPFEKGETSQPKRGRLNDVTMRLYPDDRNPDPAIRQHQSIVLTTNNLAFDNETFEVTTEAIHDNRGMLIIPADEVPIHVTGDYKFEGRGLTLRWNQVDGRLELLEIAHGDFLEIEHPGDLPGGPSAAKPSIAHGSAQGPLRGFDGVPLMYAATKNRAVVSGAALPASKPAEQRAGQPPYRATFFDAVRITQGIRGVHEQDMASADLMHVDFRPNQSDSNATAAPSTRPATRPTGAPATKPVAAMPAAATSTVAPARPATAPVSTPSTQPIDQTQQPIIVRWNGLLRVTPLDADVRNVPVGLKPGESILHLIGEKAPVRISRDLDRARCASMDYYSADGSASLRNSTQFPQVVLTQYAAPAAAGQRSTGQDAVVVTEALDYSGEKKVAHLMGLGHAHMLMKSPATAPSDDKPKAAEAMDAHWTRSALLYFADASGSTASPKNGASAGQGNLVIQHATLEGDVDVKHPQMALKSQVLDLLWGPPTAHSSSATHPSTQPADKQPDLKQVIATDGVWCKLQDQSGKVQEVTGDKLTMFTGFNDQDKVYPRIIHIDGHAHAYDPTQDLRAGHVDLTLAPIKNEVSETGRAAHPSTHPADPDTNNTATVELETMTALDNVRVVNAEGSIATSQEMYVVMKDHQPHARLVGRPDATVMDAKKNILVGPVITIDPKQNKATVEGQGHMHVIRQETPQERPRPMDVSWVTGAFVNGPENWIDVHGPAQVVTPDPDGTLNTATAKRIRIELADKPTAPAAPIATTRRALAQRPARGAGAASQSDSADPGVGGFMKDKIARAIVLDTDAVVKSSLKDPAGAILREMELKSSLIRYEMGTGGAQSTQATGAVGSAKGKLIVPRPGRMIVRDHRPPAVNAGGVAAAPPANDMSSSRGATAFQWSRDLTYDEGSQIAIFSGDVVVVHKDDAPNAEPVRMDADRMEATFMRRPIVAKAIPARPATAPATAPAPAEQAAPLQLKWLTSLGHLNVTRAGSVLTGDRMDYDPASGWMIVTGSGRNPAVMTNPQGVPTASGDQILWNTQSWQAKVRNLSSRTEGETPKANPKGKK